MAVAPDGAAIAAVGEERPPGSPPCAPPGGDVLMGAYDLSVRFGATVALDNVSLNIRRSEVHALVGENGAGKSTLMRCLAGMLEPAEGKVERVAGLDVAWVPQEPILPADLTVREWIFLGEEMHNGMRFLRKQAMNEASEAALRELGADVSPARRLGTLAAPQRKQVQLARALRQGARVLLLDEPTAVLGARETEALFAAIGRLRERDGAVLYVSHRLEEVRAIAYRVTVLRDGRCITTSNVQDVDTATLIERMVGRTIPPRSRNRRRFDAVALELRRLRVAHVQDVSFSLHAGEIVGIAGLLGAGRSEILEAIAGVTPMTDGYVSHVHPLAFVPEDRGTKGLLPTFDVRRNIFTPARGRLIRHGEERREAAGWVQRLQIRARSVDAPIASLSGGNQQKVLLARALRRSPKLLLLDEPTAGVDVGAKTQIHDWITKLADAGTGILIASSDMLELLTMCDRILALRAGHLVEVFQAESTTEAQLARAITGAGG